MGAPPWAHSLDLGERQDAVFGVLTDPEDGPPQLRGVVLRLLQGAPEGEPATSHPDHGEAGFVGTIVGDPMILRVCGGLPDLLLGRGEVDFDDRVVQRAAGGLGDLGRDRRTNEGYDYA